MSMARTPTSYNPSFWRTVPFRSLDLYSGQTGGEAKTVAQLLVEYFRHSTERPTHFSYHIKGARQCKLKPKAIDSIIERVAPVEGHLESMYIEAVRDNDHTHSVASAGYNYSKITRANAHFGFQCFKQDFDLQLARHLAIMVSDAVSLDYGFSRCEKGLMNACAYGFGMRIIDDKLSAKRERWIQEFNLKDPRPSDVPFLDIFELNVLSDLHLYKKVAGKPFEAYVHEKGCGTLERIGKANFLWRLEENDIARAKRDLSDAGLIALV
jgi:hypothetical protein